ncbi:phage tail protein [Thiotrichales bacterium 19X7-9]|nr:phage tail protein [Thiotrichales bacterium 19X7-9]
MYEIKVTDIGKSLLAQAILDKSKVKFDAFKISSVTDDVNLSSVVYTDLISKIEVRTNELIFTCVVPEGASGFWLRSIALLDDQERVIAYGNIPEIYKSDDDLSPSVSNYTITLQIDNADQINIEFNSQACSTVANYYQLAESLICLMKDHTQLAWDYAKEKYES